MEYGRDVFQANHKTIWLSLASEVGVRPVARDAHVNIPSAKETVQALNSELSRRETSAFLISFEGFSSVLFYEGYQTIFQRLESALPPDVNLKVICYCRDPLGALVSNYNQRCKNSPYVGPFLDYVMQRKEALINQLELVNAYVAAFGGENIILKRYGETKGARFVADFLETLGAEMGDILLESSGDVNGSTPPEQMEQSRILANLKVVREDQVDRYIFGSSQPLDAEWESFLSVLDRTNRDNAKLFRSAFGVEIKPVTLADLIWQERRFNHASPTRAFVANIAAPVA